MNLPLRHLLLLALLLPACAEMTGSGVDATQTRDVGAFTRISVESGITATVQVGERSPLVITGEDNLLGHVLTRVRDGELTVAFDGRVKMGHGIRVLVGTQVLDAINASGGSRVEASALRGDAVSISASGGSRVHVGTVDATTSLEVSSSGGSRLELAGSAPTLLVDSSGGSALDASRFAAKSATLDLSGGSRATATVAGKVTGSLSGGSQAFLAGRPDIAAVETSGGSKVRLD